MFESNILFLLQLLFYFQGLWWNSSTDLTSASSQTLKTFPTTRMQIQHGIYFPPPHMIDFAAAASWIERRRNDAAEGTPKRDRFDFLDLKVDLAHHLLSKKEVQDNEDVDVPGPQAPKRKMPMPSDALRTSHSSGHLPEWPENGKPSRCRLPGCDSPKCRIRCSTCKVFLCLNANRNCFKLFHEVKTVNSFLCCLSFFRT